MRIDRLHIQNFRKFAELTLELHPQFTLLVGNNGSGKTTILNALAICLNVLCEQLATSVGLTYYNSQGPTIQPKDARLEPVKMAERTQFREQLPVSVQTTGHIRGEELTWGLKLDIHRSQSRWAGDNLIEVFREVANNDPLDESFAYPVLALYHVTRTLPATLDPPRDPLTPPRRWDAYVRCFDKHINYDELRRWFYRETAAAGANGGHRRSGYEVVRRAVFSCVPGADNLWFDVDYADLVCSIGGQTQPLGNLSDGQRMLLAMVADIAIKAVTLNAHLLPADKLGLEDEPTPRILQQTSGVVLIDELDAHLHPSWQRRVAADLKRTFPAIQFICTSHSPQVIGEVPPEQIRIIDGDFVYSPEHSFGVDSSRILEEIMDTKPRTESVDALLTKLARQISDDDFDGARDTIKEAEAQLGANDPEITSARTLMAFTEQKS